MCKEPYEASVNGDSVEIKIPFEFLKVFCENMPFAWDEGVEIKDKDLFLKDFAEKIKTCVVNNETNIGVFGEMIDIIMMEMLEEGREYFSRNPRY